MTLLRFTMDIIIPDNPTNRTFLKNLWNNLKTKKTLFMEISKTSEISKIELHLCHHDVDPSLPCETKKQIILNDILQDDVV